METSVTLTKYYLKACALYTSTICPKCGDRGIQMCHSVVDKTFSVKCNSCKTEATMQEREMDGKDYIEILEVLVDRMLNKPSMIGE